MRLRKRSREIHHHRRALVPAGAAVLGLVACGGSGPAETTASPSSPAPPSPPGSAAATASASATGPVPAAELEGAWSGRTSAGDEFSFTVSGGKVSEVTVPKMGCGAGMASTVETGSPIKGNAFAVVSLPLPYTLYPRGGGRPVKAQDETTVKGTFSSGTSANGTIVTRVVTGRRVTGSCRKSWTATRG